MSDGGWLKLAPCPWCGPVDPEDASRLLPDVRVDVDGDEVRVECIECDARGPAVTLQDSSQQMAIYTAIRKWNYRSGQEAA